MWPLPLDCHPRGRPTFGSVAALLLSVGNALQFLPESASSFGLRAGPRGRGLAQRAGLTSPPFLLGADSASNGFEAVGGEVFQAKARDSLELVADVHPQARQGRRAVREAGTQKNGRGSSGLSSGLSVGEKGWPSG